MNMQPKRYSKFQFCKYIIIITINSYLSAFVVKYSADAAPQKVEVFVNDQKVLVDPGTTILQVNYGRKFQIIDSRMVIGSVLLFLSYYYYWPVESL